MNTELLFQLYAIHSPSGCEKKMRRFIRKYITDNCGDVAMETDKYGNLLCVKGNAGTYPCLAAHMDQVQRDHSKDFRVISDGYVCFGYSDKSHEQQGLGADDKNGIFVCLECLRTFDVLKVAFFVGEETGCDGSSDVDLQFFKDCRFIIEPDRRGSSDLITSMYCGQVCSDSFINATGHELFGYKRERGTVTDVGTLVERGVGISCLNLSCGYYEAHTDHEFTVLPELCACLEFVMHIIRECTDVYPFEGGYGGYGSIYGFGRSLYGRQYWGGFGNTDRRASEMTVKELLSGMKDVASSSTQTAQGSSSDNADDEEAWAEYYGDGYYDEDLSLMEEYIHTMPDITFDMIKQSYMDDFHASYFFDKVECENMLSEVYNDASDLMTDTVYFSGMPSPATRKVS